MMTPARIRRELRRLLGEEKTPAAAAEAARLVEEYRREEVRPRRPAPSAAELAATERREENARWQRTLRRIGRGGGAMSTVVYRPGGREREPARVRENEEKTYARKSSPWL